MSNVGLHECFAPAERTRGRDKWVIPWEKNGNGYVERNSYRPRESSMSDLGVISFGDSISYQLPRRGAEEFAVAPTDLFSFDRRQSR